MRKKTKRLVALLSLLLVISMIPIIGLTVEAAAKPKLAKKTVSIVVGEKDKIKVKNAPKGANITYKSAKKNVATVSKKGMVKGIKSGTTKITVSIKKNSKTTKLTYKVTVKKPKLSKSKLSLVSGKTAKLSVKNKPKKAKYTWQSNNPKVATVNKNGKVAAKTKGTANIKIKVKTAKKTYSLSCKVTVKAKPDNPETQTYTVTFDSNGGSSVASQTVEKNAQATRPTDPTQNGYTFDGWYTAASGGQNFDFNTAITKNITLYAHWKSVSPATDYYENNSKLIETIEATESDGVLTETSAKLLLEDKGLGDNAVFYEYSITGEKIEETEVVEGFADKHPMFQTVYVSKNDEIWIIYIINDSIFAYPVSFGLESDLGVELIFSESETLTSYDDATNQFYVTIPHTSEMIVEVVDKIDAETLDRLTVEEICRLSGATIPAVTVENDYSSDIASMLSLDETYPSNSESALTMNGSGDHVIVVSLGDSYSSGEGIEKFYGQDKPLEQKVKDDNWLAHRSTKSWPSLLEIPGIAGTMAKYMVQSGTTSDSGCQWYFAAASGATTWNFKHEQDKPYYKKTGLFSSLEDKDAKLPPQEDVFTYIQGNDVDYVTLTIGGNDVDFQGVITCCIEPTYLEFGNNFILENKLSSLWNNIDSTMNDIKQVYEGIHAKAPNAAIIVAGYPKLLDKNGKGAIFSKNEATLVNEKVSAFNLKIKELVETCESELNTHFVNVETEFDKDGGHQAYSPNEWINPIIIPKKGEDINEHGFPFSAYSIHPNEKGAQAYARCVNAKIEEIENSKVVIDHRYEIYDLGMTWNEAKAYCESLGGHLAVITSIEEQKNIEKLLCNGEKNSYWIGGYKDLDGLWSWITKESFSYQNWASNQPDNNKYTSENGEDSLMIYKNSNPLVRSSLGQWNDLYHDGTCGNESFFGLNNFGFICEWDNKN